MTVRRWRLRTEHVTTFDYSAAARASYNEVRQIPQTTARQTALEARVATTPAAPQYTYRDYWGTQVVAFNVDGPHDRLVVQGTALVDTQSAGDPPDAGWDEVAAAGDRYAELLAPSRYTWADGALAEVAASLRAAPPVTRATRTTPAATVEAVMAWTHGSLDYVRGVTHVHTSAAEAFGAGSGVCQDFAHLALAVLRAAGIPARYVSGYLHPDPDAEVGATSAGESHAWVEAWVGDWWGLDPTNGTDIGVRHVVVARGRDYADVAPVRGVYAGSAEHQASVTVKVTRAA
ncbi:MAG TPA: transglutaminase family protein [Acidimicrobiales bacterium]|nr:transglutaminase family protein [Acidimicrobiales bacterium]